MPSAAMKMINLNGAALEPIEEFKKLTASLPQRPGPILPGSSGLQQ